MYTPSFKTFIAQQELIDILFLARTKYRGIRFNRFFLYAILSFLIFIITFLPDIVFAESPEITKPATRILQYSRRFSGKCAQSIFKSIGSKNLF